MVIWFFLLVPPSALFSSASNSLFIPQLCLSVFITVVLWLNYGLWSGSIGPCVAAVLAPTNLPLQAAQATLSAFTLYARSPYPPQCCPVTFDHKGKNEARDKREENKHWPRGCFFAYNIIVRVCVCKSMRCSRNVGVVWLLLSGM